MTSGNNYPKPLEDLLKLIGEQKKDLCRKAINSLPLEHQVVLKCTLAHLEDGKWAALVIRLASASSEQIRHYVNILGAYYSGAKQQQPTPAVKRPEPRVEMLNNERSELSGSELRAFLDRLPVELHNGIVDTFLEYTLEPDFVFPDQEPGPNGLHEFHGHFYAPTKYEVLLGLNRANFDFHGSQFWENYFVVGRGDKSQTMNWLHRMKPDIQAKLQNVYINLASADLDIDETGTSAEYMAWTCYHQGTFEDPLDLMSDFDQEANRHNGRLMSLWWRKLWEFRNIGLKNLVIDVRGAYGIDGGFLGERFMTGCFVFGRKRPENVKILAESEEVAARLLSMFWKRNDGT